MERRWKRNIQRRSKGSAGRTGRHLLGAANGRKLFLKIHMKIQVVISYMYACNKNKALQLQRVPIFSMLGYNFGSLAASGSSLLVLREFYTLNRLCSFRPAPSHPSLRLWRAANLTTAPSGRRSWYATGNIVSRVSSVIAVMRLPISCVSSVAILCHVLAVSVANE